MPVMPLRSRQVPGFAFRAALLGAALLVGGCRQPPGELDLAGLRAELRAAIGRFRPVLGRTSLELDYAPCAAEPEPRRPPGETCDGTGARLSIPRCRGSVQAGAARSRRLLGLRRQVKSRTGDDPASPAYALDALLDLLWSREESGARAASERLRRAASRRPSSAVVRNDLAVALLELAGRERRPDLLVEAYSAAAAAVRLAPDYEPALFNRALILSHLLLPTPAQRAWQEFQALGPAEAWAEEARAEVAALPKHDYEERWRREVEPALRGATLAPSRSRLRALVAAHRQRAREWAERDLLAEWGTAVADRRPEAARRALELAAAIGQALAPGDRMLADAVAAIREARGDPPRTAALAEGHTALSKGFEELYAWRYATAAPWLTRARARFTEADSPFGLWARFYLGLLAYYRSDYESAGVELDALAAAVEPLAYPVLLGRVRWIQGLLADVERDLGAGLARYEEALERFCAAGEAQNRASAHYLIAGSLSKLGRYRESWSNAWTALHLADEVFLPVRRHALLETMILAADRQGLEELALALGDEQIGIARAAGGRELLHSALMRRGAAHHALGDREAAARDLAAAVAAAEEIEDARVRARSRADLDLITAELLAAERPAEAVDRVTRTIDTYRESGFGYLLARAYGVRSEAFERLGERARAEADLAEEIRLHEGSAAGLRSDPARLSFDGTATASFDRMVGWLLERGAAESAFEYAERARARSLLDEFERAGRDRFPVGPDSPRVPVAPLGLAEVQSRLEEGEVVLVYAVLAESVVGWLVSPTGFLGLRLEPTPARLSALATELGERVRSGAEWRRAAAALHDELLGPFVERLKSARRVVVVPDKFLWELPFELLVDRVTDRVLIERHVVSLSPSASLFVRMRERLAARWSQPVDRVLAVNGAGDGFRYAALPGAEREARSVASLYPGGSRLAGDRLDKDTLLGRMGDAQIVQLAMHAIVNREQPLASRLVLEDSRQTIRTVAVSELYGADLDSTALVVLSACSTASGSSAGVAGGIARPFLAAGVPAVVVSLWDVDDDATQISFAAFHRRIAEGEEPAAALRSAKLELLSSGSPELSQPRRWAPFVLIGG